jgi:hypothetical protein
LNWSFKLPFDNDNDCESLTLLTSF